MQRIMQTYFILEDSRSGSSLCARILHTNGISMGKRFRDPSINNPKGYYEDIDVKDFNKLVRGGASEEILHGTAKKLIDSLKTEKWGFKNPPWLTYQLDYFLPYLEEVKYIVTTRNREDQKRSITSAINSRLTDEQLNERLENTYSKIEEIIKDKPHCVVDFDVWFTNKAQEQMRQLADFCQFEYSPDLLQKYVDPKLHRFKDTNTVADV